jgi:DUF4097 and DUF4098 domain-containing protein YvlB
MRLARHAAWVTIIASVSFAHVQRSFAQHIAEFHRTLTVTPAETVTLDVEVPSGELQISYGRDGQMSIAGVAKSSAEAKLDDNFFPSVLTIDQDGNHIRIKQVSPPAFPEKSISVVYRIDVPYRTILTSSLTRGRQSIRGILGPVKAMTEKGDILAAYISKGLEAQVENGNLDLQVIGDHVEAKAETGNISCTRVPQGVSAETGDGDITLMVVGSSTASVRKGNGRIDVRGARGSVVASTDRGDLHVRAIPHQDWRLSSGSGSIRLEIPPAAQFELDASTTTGEIQLNRDDLAKSDSDALQFHQKVNGGGTRVGVHTESGGIAIQ